MKLPNSENCCLRPYHPDEAAEVHWIAKEHGRSERTIRNWCAQFGIGRQLTVRGPWSVSKVALLMFLDGNTRALDAYLSGQRQCDLVAQYYRRAGPWRSPRTTGVQSWGVGWFAKRGLMRHRNQGHQQAGCKDDRLARTSAAPAINVRAVELGGEKSSDDDSL